MKNKLFLMKTLIIMLVFVMLVSSCNNGTTIGNDNDNKSGNHDDGGNKELVTAITGEDRSLLLSQLITLDGSDSLGNIVTYEWSCTSYTANQGTVSISYTLSDVNEIINNSDKGIATVAVTKAGTYIFKLTVTGTTGEKNSKEVTITIKPLTKEVNIEEITSDYIVPSYNFIGNENEYFKMEYISCLNNVSLPLIISGDHISVTGLYNLAVTISLGPQYFTQNFLFNGQEINTRTVEVEVTWRSGIGAVVVYVSGPSLTLNLIKTELD